MKGDSMAKKMNTWIDVLLSNICCVLIIPLMSLIFLTSNWTNGIFHIPISVSRMGTLLAYIPFLCFCCIKLWSDVKHRKYSAINAVYYLFVLYYLCLTAYRFVTGMEVKENLYYTIVLLGSVSLFLLMWERREKLNFRQLSWSVVVLSGVVAVYWVWFVYAGKAVFGNSPINNNLIGTMLLILFPVASFLMDRQKSTVCKMLLAVILIGMSYVILTLGARSIFLLFCVELIVLLSLRVIFKQTVRRFICVVIASILLVTTLFALDHADVRYNTYRQLGIMGKPGVTESADTTPPPSEAIPPQSEAPSHDTVIQNQAHAQISRSDKMRSDLMKTSLEQVRQNPWFGTGDVLYAYALASVGTTFMQSSHNIVLETLNCYGIVGLIIIMTLVIMILSKVGLFQFRIVGGYEQHTSLLLILVFLAETMVQPVGYNLLILPLLMIGLAYMSIRRQRVRNSH